MKGEWLRAFGFFFVMAFLGILAYATLPRLLGAASGPEGELLTLIKSQEADGLSLEVPGAQAPLRSTVAHFDRITITASADGRSAEAVATLDFTGGLGATKVSSLGFEKLRFVKGDSGWEIVGSYAPRLVRIVTALDGRRRALDRGERMGADDGGTSAELAAWIGYTGRQYDSKAWYIRSERDEVLVTEDAIMKAKSPDRPIHEPVTRRLILRETAAGEFFFPGGLL